MIEIDVSHRQGDFELRAQAKIEGPVTAVSGPSGAGKTTLLRILAGLAGGGTVRVGGEDWTALPPQQRRVGYVPQDGGLFPHLTVRRNVEYGATGSVSEALKLLEIGDLADRRPAEISGGQARRVALARALATRPRLLLLDEPLVGLEISLQDRVLAWISRVRERHDIPILYVSHQYAEVLRLADDSIVLEAGRVVATGPPETTLPPSQLVNRWRLPVRDGSVRFGDQAIVLEKRAKGPEVDVSLRTEEVLLATERPSRTSARNILEGRVTRLVDRGSRMLVTCDVGELLIAAVTPAASRELGLKVGARVYCIVKATSFL